MRKTGLMALAILATLTAGDATALCLRSIDIDHTDVKNDRAILFYMRDRTVYRNDLPQRCPTLASAPNGFTYEPTDPSTDEICDNLAVFRVNGSFGPSFNNGPVCMFGAFTQVK